MTNPRSVAALGTLKTSSLRSAATYCSSTFLRSCDCLSPVVRPRGQLQRVVPEASRQSPGWPSRCAGLDRRALARPGSVGGAPRTGTKHQQSDSAHRRQNPRRSPTSIAGYSDRERSSTEAILSCVLGLVGLCRKRNCKSTHDTAGEGAVCRNGAGAAREGAEEHGQGGNRESREWQSPKRAWRGTAGPARDACHGRRDWA